MCLSGCFSNFILPFPPSSSDDVDASDHSAIFDLLWILLEHVVITHNDDFWSGQIKSLYYTLNTDVRFSPPWKENILFMNCVTTFHKYQALTDWPLPVKRAGSFLVLVVLFPQYHPDN